MSTVEVIACLMIYHDEKIVLQASFQVQGSVNVVSFPSTEGDEFAFTHSYKGTQCDIALSHSKKGSIVAECELAVPINRTKIKWKQTPLGDHQVYYRCQLEDWDSEKTKKAWRKQRRKALKGEAR